MKNWKTTLFGVLGAAAVGVSQYPDPTIAKIAVILAAVLPNLGLFFAKDKNVTGGTVQQ
jgi:hypothetical protein